MSSRPSPRQSGRTAVSAAVALAIATLIGSPSAFAANKYWDLNGTTAGLGAGSGAWDTSTAIWNTATAGTAATVAFANGDDAFFQTGAANNPVTLGLDLTANSITQTTNGTTTTINTGGGTNISLTTGNIFNFGNSALVINPNIILGANGTLFATNTITLGGVVSGAFGLNKTGAATVTLRGANTYSGGTTISAGQGTLTYAGSLATGTPFGTGSISLNGGTTLAILPSAAGTPTLSGGTVTGSQFNLTGGSYFNLNRTTATSVTYTFGPAAGTTSVINRVGNGTVVLMGSGNSGTTLGGVEQFIIAGSGAALPTVTNGMVLPYILAATNGAGGDFNFLTYDNTLGFQNATYDLTSTFAGSTSASKVNIAGATTLSADASAYAVKSSSALTLNPGVTLSIGDGTNPAGLIVNNAAAVSGGILNFGGSEAIVAVGGTNSTISSVIAGSNGLTKTQYNGTNGILTLSGVNTYTGTTTVNNGNITIATGGSLASGSNVVVNTGGSMTVNTGGAVGGNATVNGSGSMTVNTGGMVVGNVLVNPSTTTTLSTFANNGTVTGNLTVAAGTGPIVSQSNSVVSGNATLNGGSSTSSGGNIQVNGQLTIAGSTAVTLGTITSANTTNQGTGAIYYNNTFASGNTLSLANGTSLALFVPGLNSVGTLTTPGTAYIGVYGQNGTAAVNQPFNMTFGGGTWNIGQTGQNNSGKVTSGTTNILGGSIVNLSNAAAWPSGNNNGATHMHGFYNLGGASAGTLNITGNLAEAGGFTVGPAPGTTNGLAIVLNNGGVLTVSGTTTLGTVGIQAQAGSNSITVNTGGAATLTGALVIGGNTAQTAVGTETNSVTVAGGTFTANAVTVGANGTTATNLANNFNISSGSASVVTLAVGSGSNSPSATIVNTVNLSGGKLLVSGATTGISSLAGTNQTNTFNWTGGQLTALAITPGTTSGTSGAIRSTIFDTGANTVVLAPGDLGIAGRTDIKGNISTTTLGANTTLAIDISGTTQTGGFQNPSAYDNIQINPAAAAAQTLNVGGRLALNLVAFTPTNANNFDIIFGGANASSLTINGTFTNQVAGTTGSRVVVGSNGLSSFAITYDNAAKRVRLNDYQATNTYSGAGTAWDVANAGSWTSFDPGASTGASGSIAQFADGTSSTGAINVALNGTRNVRGIEFSSVTGTRSFAVTNGGSGAITLNNTANSANATITDTSAAFGTGNSIAAPITLASDVTVNVANSGNTLTLGSIAGSGRSLTKTGAGTLILAGMETYSGTTTILAGTLSLAGPTSGLASDLLVNGGALNLNGGATGLLTLGAGKNFALSAGSFGLSFTNTSSFDQIAGSGGATFDITGGTFDLGTTGIDYTFTYDILTGFASGAVSGLSFTGYDTTNFIAAFNTSGQLSFTAVPEPNAPLLLAAGGVALWVFRRRRQMSRQA